MSTDDPALQALWLPFVDGALDWPPGGALFLGAETSRVLGGTLGEHSLVGLSLGGAVTEGRSARLLQPPIAVPPPVIAPPALTDCASGKSASATSASTPSAAWTCPCRATPSP